MFRWTWLFPNGYSLDFKPKTFSTTYETRSFLEADGSTRTVEYTADDYNGFNAVVKNEGGYKAPAYSAPAYKPAAYAAPAYSAPAYKPAAYAAPAYSAPAYAAPAYPAPAYSAPAYKPAYKPAY